MNIFVTDPDPVICAQNLDDLRLNKMILETAQLLSTAANFHGCHYLPYKPTHINHPCSIWSRCSRQNYMWLYRHFNALANEKFFRTGIDHKSWVICSSPLFAAAQCIPENGLIMWPNCTPYKHIPDVHEAYRLTLLDKWAADKRPPKWTKRQKPF